jgi:two-component system KDP operon response regulator KdpE
MKIKDKVLIVEDEQSISSFISMILTANGYDTIIVNTGEEALTMISSHCPDLIVLDLGLPDMDGLEVLRSVRKWSSLPIVVVSARNHERDKVEALDYGADDYLVKPFGTSELLARIRTATPAPPSLTRKSPSPDALPPAIWSSTMTSIRC